MIRNAKVGEKVKLADDTISLKQISEILERDKTSLTAYWDHETNSFATIIEVHRPPKPEKIIITVAPDPPNYGVFKLRPKDLVRVSKKEESGYLAKMIAQGNSVLKAIHDFCDKAGVHFSQLSPEMAEKIVKQYVDDLEDEE